MLELTGANPQGEQDEKSCADEGRFMYDKGLLEQQHTKLHQIHITKSKGDIVVKYNYSICAILSPLEVNYAHEWIDYHKRIGVQHFYLATNDWDYDTKDPSVSTARLDGRTLQLPYYNWALSNLREATKWCAFIDGDEFIRCHNMDELVKGHDQDDAICLSWRLFGSSGKHFNGDYSVIRRFTKRQRGFNQHIKSIVNLENTKDKRPVFVNPHFALNIITKSVDGRIINGPYDFAAETRLNDASPYLAHFFCKTPEEFELKRKRGRIDVSENSPMLFRSESEFAEHDLNEVEDTSLLDKMK